MYDKAYRKFQSTHSVGSATSSSSGMNAPSERFNPRTPWGVRLVCYIMYFTCEVFQSTHSVGSATCVSAARHPVPNGFNPRTPWGVRLEIPLADMRIVQFQSTHSVGSATFDDDGGHHSFSVSIHALRGECDCEPSPDKTSSLVSIHALRGECDLNLPTTLTTTNSFNPRTPWGVRPAHPGRRKSHKRFQSTHSVGSATNIHGVQNWRDVPVSIHALRGECDQYPRGSKLAGRAGFNPRTPWGVRPVIVFILLPPP